MKRAASYFIFTILFVKLAFSQNIALNDLNWIIGNWKIDKNQFEVWSKLNDSILHGINFNINNNSDTIINEFISIVKRGDIFVFIAKVKGQNDGKEAEFVLSKKSTKRNLIFENKYHDFPKKIIYKFISNTNLKASIEGNGKKIEFNFLRLN